MKNKEFHKLLKKNKSKPNSGFTLTELLVGLIMSIFVVGALGFGLMQVLRTTKSETSKVAARNETSRALDFISDEVRQASTIENTSANATGFNASGKTVVLALNIPEVNTSATLGSDANAGTQERIVYYLQSATGTNWKGPLVLYRYGPPLDADGNYTNGAWDEEALIDGIDDTDVTGTLCSEGTANPSSPKGFYACIIGNNTAQLFLTSGTDTAGDNRDTYTSDTRVVARARTAPANTTNTFTSYTMSYKTLGAVYNCHPSDGSTWSMRTDFVNDGNSTSWIHQENRQPQPIKVNTSSDLVITSVPVAPTALNCLSRGDETATGNPINEPLSAYTDGVTFPDGITVPFTMKFSGTDYWKTFNGNEPGEVAPTSESDTVNDKIWVRDLVNNVPYNTILALKEGSIIPSTLNGYDFDNDGTEDQKSLGAFLKEKGYADFQNGSDSSQGYVITDKLAKDERIIAVEVGHDADGVPGFDVQDSVFILSSDVFAQEHSNP